MNLFNQFTQFIVIAIYIGLTGLWGNLLWKIRQQGWILAWIFGIIIVFPATLFLPVGLLWRVFSWVIGAALVFLFISRPKWIPRFLWTRDFIQIYYVIVMFLIVCWTIIAGQPISIMWVGVPAGAAGMSGVISSLQKQLNFKSL